MSHLTLTASFGSATRYHSGPKHVRVFGQLLVGGSGVYLFNNLEAPGPPVRLRADETCLADALMAGFAIAEPDLALKGQAASLSETCRAGTATTGDIELGAEEAAVLAKAVAGVDVALLLTLNKSDESVQADNFRGWSVTVARTAS